MILIYWAILSPPPKQEVKRLRRGPKSKAASGDGGGFPPHLATYFEILMWSLNAIEAYTHLRGHSLENDNEKTLSYPIWLENG
jgi:hypothetical protein